MNDHVKVATPPALNPAAGVDPHRRQLLALGGASALLIALPWLRPNTAAAAAAGKAPATFATAWIRIGTDNKITVVTPTAEVGQGTSTGHCQIVADELGAHWDDVSFEFAPVAEVYKSPVWKSMVTGGSTGVWQFLPVLRTAAASARTSLVAAAAAQWNVDPAACVAADGKVTHTATGRALRFGALSAAAAGLPLTEKPVLRDPKQFTLIGKPVQRLDIPAKTRGTAIYALDYKVPGMLYAAVRTSPVFGGSLASFDDKAARRMPGVRDVVRIPDGVAVVATHFWQAQKAMATLKLNWTPGPLAALDSAAISRTFHANLAKEGRALAPKGDVATAFKTAAKVIEAHYEWPFLAHTTMEPMTANAHVRKDGADIWIGTQRPDFVQAEVAQAIGLKPEQVAVHNLYAGGGFGRRQKADSAIQAALISKAVGVPVKLIWTRQEDVQHDFYRPAGAAFVRGALDAQGNLMAFENHVAAGSPMNPPYKEFMQDGIDGASMDSATPLYAIPNSKIVYHVSEVGVPVGMWRSVGASHNAFVVETFVDQLAAAAGKDPLAFRLAMLPATAKRERAVLELVAEKSGWGKPLPKGRGRGLALDHKMLDCLVAMVTEASVDAQGAITVHRIVLVADPGQVINPNAAHAQLEGAVVWGLTAALYGEITIKGGAVEQSNFDGYPMVKLADMPVVEVHLLPSGVAPEGVAEGVAEGGASPVAPSLANALFAVTGKRVLKLPFGDQFKGG